MSRPNERLRHGIALLSDQEASPGLRLWVLYTATAMAAIAAIGWVDVVTGAELGMSLFYLMPIVACAWWVGRRSAFVVSIAAALAWYVADLLTQQYSASVSTWNALTRLAIYTSVGILVAVTRRDRARLANLLAIADSLARTDELTGLANLRAFDERLVAELPRLSRAGAPLCIAYIDLDNFKQVNDRFGHERGDDVLRQVGSLLRESIRAGDVAARVGGDELALLLWDCSAEDAARVCNRIIAGVGELGASFPGTELGASAGIAWFARTTDDPKLVLARADEAMYRAKRGGKNHVVTVHVD